MSIFIFGILYLLKQKLAKDFVHDFLVLCFSFLLCFFLAFTPLSNITEGKTDRQTDRLHASVYIPMLRTPQADWLREWRENHSTYLHHNTVFALVAPKWTTNVLDRTHRVNQFSPDSISILNAHLPTLVESIQTEKAKSSLAAKVALQAHLLFPLFLS